MWLGAEQTTDSTSLPTAAAVFVISGTVFALGYRLAVMHRANVDYKATKAAVAPMRKAFWASAWSALKVAFWIFLAALLLAAWVVRDVRQVR